MRNQQAFRHDTFGSMFVHRTVITSLFVRYSVAATLAGRLVTRRHESGGRIRLRKTLHIPVTVLYTPQLLLVSLRTRISPGEDSSGHRQPAQLVTFRYLNMVTNLHIAVEACWAQTEPDLLWAIPIRIPAAWLSSAVSRTNSDSQVANTPGNLRASEPWLFLFRIQLSG